MVTGSSNKVATGTGGDSLAVLNGVSAADVIVRADIAALANGQLVGLAARYTGPGLNNGYQALLYNSNGTARASIYRNVNGTWALISADVAVGSVASVLGKTLHFEAVGSSLKFFLDDATAGTSTLLTFANDSTFGGPGGVGMRIIGTASLDNFSFDLLG